MTNKPTTYSILTELNLIVECFGGRFNASDLLKLKIEELKDPKYKSTYNFLGDLSLSTVDTTYEELVEYIQTIKSMSGIVSNENQQLLLPHPIMLFIPPF